MWKAKIQNSAFLLLKIRDRETSKRQGDDCNVRNLLMEKLMDWKKKD